MYQYRTLRHSNSFRLLTLQPKSLSPDHGIRVSLYTRRVDQVPRYEALSYVWGKDSDRIQINVNDRLLEIGPNLHSALTHLRYNDQPRTLWIDAICINQQDDVEKTHQVSQMRTIFSKACSTIIWIGVDGNVAARQLDSLVRLYTLMEGVISQPARWNDFSQHMVRAGDKMRALNPYGIFTSPAAPNAPYFMLGSGIIESAQWLLEQPYFHRSWITQEVVVSTCGVVICGSFEMSLNAIMELFIFLDILSGGVIRRMKHVSEIIHLKTWQSYILFGGGDPDVKTNPYRENNLDLINLLGRNRNKEATDLRDKIYSLLGIADACPGVHLLIDYSAHSVEELYITVAAQLVQHHPKGLSLLSYSQPCHSTRCLPSWVPDWSVPWHGGISTRDSFEAGLGYTPHHRVDRSNNTLTIRGTQIDILGRIGGTSLKDLAVDPLSPPSVLGRLHHETLDLGLHGDYPHGPISIPYNLVFLNVITAGRAVEILSTDTSNFWQYSSAGDFEINPLNPHNQRWKEVFERLSWIDREWEFFQTRRGLIGLGPANMQQGDIVCIFGGARVPFVLRPLRRSGYKLVGECYVEGLMYGEISGVRRGGHMEDFILW